VHKSYLSLIRKLKEVEGIHGFSHITGGGIVGNTKRILNGGQTLKVNWESWERPALFNLIREAGNVPEEDMRSAFNLGIGLITVCSPGSLNQVSKICSDLNEPFTEIGEVV